MLILPGASALSVFRAQGLLTKLQNVDTQITEVTAQYLHFVDAAADLSADDQARLAALLTYGEPAPASGEGEQFVVIPRFGTISPWASKATEIAQHCGLDRIRRIERGVCYRIRRKQGWLGGARALGDASI